MIFYIYHLIKIEIENIDFLIKIVTLTNIYLYYNIAMPNKKSIGKMIIFLVPLAILYYFLKLRYYEYGSYEKL